MFMLQPTSSLLTAQLENSSDLKQLAAAYANTLPLPLREIMAMNVQSGMFTGASLPPPHNLSREVSGLAVLGVQEELREKEEAVSPATVESSKAEHFGEHDPELEALFATGVPPLPTWGTVASIPYLNQPLSQDSSKKLTVLSAKSTIMIEDLLTLKSLALSSLAGPAAKASTSNMVKNKLREVIEDLPILQRDRGESIAESFTSTLGEGTDDDSDQGHPRHTGKFITGSSYEDDERMRGYERQARHGTSLPGSRHAALSMEGSSVGESTFLADMLQSAPPGPGSAARTSAAPAALQALVEDLHERQSSLQALSKPGGAMTREKLLELMNTHDKNIFKVKVAPTAPAPVHGSTSSSMLDTAPANLANKHTPEPTARTSPARARTPDLLDVASVVPPPAAAEAPATAPPPHPPLPPAPAVSEAAKRSEPLSRDEIMRAKLLGSSGAQAAARQKQLMAIQAHQPATYAAGGTNRALGAVQQQQQLRSQQQDAPEASQRATPSTASHSRTPSADAHTPPSKSRALSDGETSGSEKTHTSRTSENGKPHPEGHGVAEAAIEARHAADQSPPANALTGGKKYQRFSNRSFLGAKSLAAMGAAMGKPTPEAIARARAANPNQQFVIVHGKIVPVNAHGDAGAKQKSEQYAQYIREYSQTHCVNPFRIRDSHSYSQSQSYNRRRWVHVFPQCKLRLSSCPGRPPNLICCSLYTLRNSQAGHRRRLRAQLEEPHAARHPAADHGLRAFDQDDGHEVPGQRQLPAAGAEEREPLRHAGGPDEGADLSASHAGMCPRSIMTRVHLFPLRHPESACSPC
jgi:hypothetical protein